MLAGAESIKIHGQYVRLRAVAQTENLSAHAGCEEILSGLGHFEAASKVTILTHGEPEAAKALAQRINHTRS